MRFGILGHLIHQDDVKKIPKKWRRIDNLFVSPELMINKTPGHLICLNLTAHDMIHLPQKKVREYILHAAVYAQNKLDIEVIQLGALTTSVTSGGTWFLKQKKYIGFVNHGDSYTAVVTCQSVQKTIDYLDKDPSKLTLAIVGAYGIIGEAVSKNLTHIFNNSILIGRREEKLKQLKKQIKGNVETTKQLKTEQADVIVTATNHPKALLESKHLKKNAIIVDVSQPPNLSKNICTQRKDVVRIDGGYVEFPLKQPLSIPGMPKTKIFACIAEVMMQALENERQNHVGTININHLKKTEKWAQKYGFVLRELTNFGTPIDKESEYQ